MCVCVVVCVGDLPAALPLTFTLADTGCQFISRLNIYQPFIYDTLDEVLLLAFSSSLKRYGERQVYVCACVCARGGRKRGQKREAEINIFLLKALV